MFDRDVAILWRRRYWLKRQQGSLLDLTRRRPDIGGGIRPFTAIEFVGTCAANQLIDLFQNGETDERDFATPIAVPSLTLRNCSQSDPTARRYAR